MAGQSYHDRGQDGDVIGEEELKIALEKILALIPLDLILHVLRRPVSNS